MEQDLLEENQAIAEINIVPFVDIILVILIIFMITAPFVVKTGFSLNLPSAGSAQKIEFSKIHITVQVDGSILLNGKLLKLNTLQEELQKLISLKEDSAQVIISADKNVLHGKVIGLIDEIKSLGVNKVAITTKKSGK